MIIYGKNAVREALKAKIVKELHLLNKGEKDEIAFLAKRENVSVKVEDDPHLTKIAKNQSHQGFVAICDDVRPVSLEELIKQSKAIENPLLVMLDGIEDPQNLGAIIRSVDGLGAQGVIIKSHGEAPLNSTVMKVSTGAAVWVKVAVVTNLNQAISKLKENGYWIVASDGSAELDYDQVDYKCPICLIIGSEGFGISRLVLKNSDFVVKIPMSGHVNSLNASVSAAILMAMVQSLRR